MRQHLADSLHIAAKSGRGEELVCTNVLARRHALRRTFTDTVGLRYQHSTPNSYVQCTYFFVYNYYEFTRMIYMLGMG